MRSTVRAIGSSLLMLAVIACSRNREAGPANQAVQKNIEAYQRALIARGVTGGSVAGVFRGADTVAHSIVNSGIPGDRAISANTIFPIWSMSKPITVAAMMILREKGLYDINDPVSK